MNFGDFVQKTHKSPVSEVSIHTLDDGDQEQEKLNFNDMNRQNDMSHLTITQIIEYQRIMKLSPGLREIHKVLLKSRGQ